MRVFIVTLVASTVLSVGLWQFGLARKIWPAHPILATTVIAAICGIAVQVLSRDALRGKAE